MSTVQSSRAGSSSQVIGIRLKFRAVFCAPARLRVRRQALSADRSGGV